MVDSGIIHGRLQPVAVQACAMTPCHVWLEWPSSRMVTRQTRLDRLALPALAAFCSAVIVMVQASQKAHQNFGPAFAYRIAATFQSLGYALEDPQQGLRKCKLLRAGLNIASASLATWQLMRRCSLPASCVAT